MAAEALEWGWNHLWSQRTKDTRYPLRTGGPHENAETEEQFCCLSTTLQGPVSTWMRDLEMPGPEKSCHEGAWEDQVSPLLPLPPLPA